MRNWYDGNSIAFDLDGTIFTDAFPDLGEPIPDVVYLMKNLKAAGWYIVVATSRPHAYFADIRNHLDRHFVPCDQIVTAGKPNVDIYVDDRGLLPPIHALDALIETRKDKDWLQKIGQPGGYRSDWTTEQASVPENSKAKPMYDDPDFRVVVAFSGGMDSLTMAQMAHLEGLPHELVYVNVGQEYAASEMHSATNLAYQVSGKWLHQIDGPQLQSGWKHIIPGRNAAILTSIAQWASKKGWWGEIWFGNLGGESPVVGGDKSSRFLLTMQHLFTIDGIDFRIMSPLRGLDKPDLVRMWFGWSGMELLAEIKSCFHPKLQRCGACQTCARTLLAYEAAGQEWGYLFDKDRVNEDMGDFFDKYAELMPKHMNGESSRYSPRRAADTIKALESLRKKNIWRPVGEAT